MAASVLSAIESGIARLTLARPDTLNALDAGMAEALRSELDRLAGEDSVGCVVIRGAGGHFMSGGDIGYFAETLDSGEGLPARVFDAVHGAVRTIRSMPQPVIACVEGACAGFGVSLVAACDLALAAEEAVFTLAYRHIGTSPDGGATWLLPRQVGLKRASAMVLLGERFDAPAAVRAGLINECLPTDRLQARLDQWAGALAGGPRRALARGKRLLQSSQTATLDQQFDAEQACFTECAREPDFAEGVRAYLEKRAPRFSGRA